MLSLFVVRVACWCCCRVRSVLSLCVDVVLANCGSLLLLCLFVDVVGVDGGSCLFFCLLVFVGCVLLLVGVC